jgi:hypothetical protein
VLLLRPARPDSGFSFENSERPPCGATEIPNRIVTATICNFDSPVDDTFLSFFESALKPILLESGASLLARFVTESSENNFPALPVREGENVFVWFSRFADAAALDHSQKWRDKVLDALRRRLTKSPQMLKLSPTSRSRLR